MATSNMDNPIELPGEANPFNLHALEEALNAGVGVSTQHRISAVQQLETWSEQPLFYEGLAHLYADSSQPTQMRALGVIYLKGRIDTFWRKASTKSLTRAEKENLKTKLLDGVLAEQHDYLATQATLALAKVARYDFPNDWPTVLSVETLRNLPKHSLQFRRGLQLYLGIVKELASIRLRGTKLRFQASVPELFEHLSLVFFQVATDWNNGQRDPEIVKEIILLLKILRHLFIAGYEHPNRVPELQSFWMLTHLEMFGAWPQVDSLTVLAGDEPIHKIYYQVVKFHLKVAQTHPAAFVLLPGFPTIVNQHWKLSIAQLGAYWTSTSAQAVNDPDLDTTGDAEYSVVKLGLMSLLLFRVCAKMTFGPAHAFTSHIKEEREERDEAVKLLRSALYNDYSAVTIAQYLMVNFFPLRKEDILQWGNSPDEYEQRVYGDSNAWEYSVRGCAEKLFLDLVINYKDVLIPQIMEAFTNIANGTTQDIFLKDSILCAVGLASCVLYDKLDFNAFLEQALLRDVSIQEPGYHVLRRRIAILLGEWTPVIPEKINRKVVYHIFRLILNPEDPTNDQVVRITAGMQLKEVIEPFEFEVGEFLEDAPSLIQYLIQILGQTNTSEVKLGLLETLRTMTSKMESFITPHAPNLIQELSNLWVSDGSDLLINEAIISILSAMITSLKQESVNYLGQLIPLITEVLTVTEMQETLLTETLDLLAAILVQTPEPLTGQATALTTLIVPLSGLLDLGTDQVRQTLELLGSYALLHPLQTSLFRIFACAEALLGTPKNEVSSNVLKLIERAIQADIMANHPTGVKDVMRCMVLSSLLAKLLSGLQEGWEARETTGPNRKSSNVYGALETDYIAIFCRFILADANEIGIAISYVSEIEDNTIPADCSARLIAEVFAHFDNVGDLARKKLIALALTHLLIMPTSLGDAVRSHFQELMSVCTDVITALNDAMPLPQDGVPAPQGPIDSLVTDFSIAPSDPNITPEYLRVRRLEAHDPVYVINLPSFVKNSFVEFRQLCGSSSAFEDNFLHNVDPEVIRGFQALGLA